MSAQVLGSGLEGLGGVNRGCRVCFSTLCLSRLCLRFSLCWFEGFDKVLGNKSTLSGRTDITASTVTSSCIPGLKCDMRSTHRASQASSLKPLSPWRTNEPSRMKRIAAGVVTRAKTLPQGLDKPEDPSPQSQTLNPKP